MAPSTADQVLSALAPRRLRDKGHGRYICDSPLRAGSDSHAFSLLISGPEHGGYLDFVSGDKGSLYELAARLGIATPRRDSSRRELVAVYPYTDAAGTILYEACRYEPGHEGKPKDFNQRVPDGQGGYRFTMDGVTRVLYHLPAVLSAVAAGETLYIVEGEKDADTLTLYERTATTNVAGAGKWRNEYNETLRGATVVILPDNDAPGTAHADTVARALCGIAASVKVVNLPGLQPKGDFTDWTNAGHTIEELDDLVQATTEYAPIALAAPAQVEDSEDKPNQTDVGNGTRLARKHGDIIRYVHTWGSWLIYDRGQWTKDNTGAIIRLARSTVKAMYAEASQFDTTSDRKNAARWAMTSESAGKIAAMIDLAKSEPGIAVRDSMFDTDPMLLNCLNGTLDLQTGELRPHAPSDLITRRLDVAYRTDATAPNWDRFIARITNGDPALAAYLQRAAGYSLTGDVSEQCLFFCYGGGSNGKTTFLETLASLLGSYSQRAAAEMLMQQRNGGGIPNDVARLQGSRFVVASEVSEGRRLDESKVKDLTGGDTVTARFMRAEFFDFKPIFKLWMFGNHKPIIRGADNGIWRRLRVLPFLATITEEEKDLHFSQKLKKEMPGILAWCVRGCLDWQRNGLNAPTTVTDATNEYRNEQDIIGAFLSECCVLNPKAYTPMGELYEAYTAWCECSGEHALPKNQLATQLEKRGYPSKRTMKGFNRHGIGLLETKYDPMIHDDPRIDMSAPFQNSHEGMPDSGSSWIIGSYSDTANGDTPQQDALLAGLPGVKLVRCDHKGNPGRYGIYWKAVGPQGETDPLQSQDSVIAMARRMWGGNNA
jgi:putative DNA primase/helicase